MSAAAPLLRRPCTPRSLHRDIVHPAQRLQGKPSSKAGRPGPSSPSLGQAVEEPGVGEQSCVPPIGQALGLTLRPGKVLALVPAHVLSAGLSPAHPRWHTPVGSGLSAGPAHPMARVRAQPTSSCPCSSGPLNIICLTWYFLPGGPGTLALPPVAALVLETGRACVRGVVFFFFFFRTGV